PARRRCGRGHVRPAATAVQAAAGRGARTTEGGRMTSDTNALLDREIDDLLLDIRGFALVRDLLVQRGATAAEVDSHARALARARPRRAELIRGPGEAGVVGGDHRLNPVAHAQLAEDAREVRLDRRLAEVEPGSELRVRQPRREQRQDLALAIC